MSSVHEGVSCDTCTKNNFSGRRYKCLICYDFDLCSQCYEDGAVNAQHINTHPMQCILTHDDYALHYFGDTSFEAQSFTCPYCGKMGFSEATLCEHVTVEHEDDNYEVVCPICAAVPMIDPNHLTEDLANHLNLEHRGNSNSATLSGTIDDSTVRFSRRLNSRTAASRRGGRNTFQFGATSTLSSLVSREGMDPIAELLSQLSGVRRAAASAQNSSLHLQHLQAQLSRERDHLQQSRQLFGKTQAVSKQITSNSNANNNNNNANNINANNTTASTANTSNAPNTIINQILELPNIFQTNNTVKDSRFLLSKYDSNAIIDNQQKDPIKDDQGHNKVNTINQSFFIHDILLTTFMKQLEINENLNNDNNNIS